MLSSKNEASVAAVAILFVMEIHDDMKHSGVEH